LEEKAREKSSSELREMWRAFVEKEGKEVGKEGGRKGGREGGREGGQMMRELWRRFLRG